MRSPFLSTFATAEGSDDSELFVGVLGAEAEPPQFALLRLSSAGEAELLAQIDVEFDYRTAPLPQFGPDVAHHKGNGIPLLGFYDPKLPSLSFYHYDGYELRVFRAQNQGRSWELSQEKHTLHDERTDLSAPGD